MCLRCLFFPGRVCLLLVLPFSTVVPIAAFHMAACARSLGTQLYRLSNRLITKSLPLDVRQHSLHRPFLVFPHECEACKIAVRRQTAITFAVRLPSATPACTRDACIVQASYSAVRPTRSAGAGGHVIRSLLGTSGPAVTLGELRYGAPCNRQGSARPTDRAGRPWRGASTAHPI